MKAIHDLFFVCLNGRKLFFLAPRCILPVASLDLYNEYLDVVHMPISPQNIEPDF